MSIPKRTGINYRDYLDDLIKEKRTHIYPIQNDVNCNALKDIERLEFAGYLFKNDIEENSAVLEQILQPTIYETVNIIADYLINDQPENGARILNHIKQLIINFYQDDMQTFLDDAHESIEC